MALAVVVVATVAVNGQVLVEDNSVLVGPGDLGQSTQETTGKHASFYLIHYDFAVHLSMPGYTCEYMCIPFSVIREISGQLITTISLAHNINLVVSMSECLLTTPPTHTLPTPNGA